jgi:hypothetical protein
MFQLRYPQRAALKASTKYNSEEKMKVFRLPVIIAQEKMVSLATDF